MDVDEWTRNRTDEDILRQDAKTAAQLQELARQGKVFICYGRPTLAELQRLDDMKLKRWNAGEAKPA